MDSIGIMTRRIVFMCVILLAMHISFVSAYQINNTPIDGLRPYIFTLTINNSIGVNNATHVFCNGHCNSNFTDVRFTLSSAPLNYWFENTTTGKVWVNVTGNGTVIMDYGNPTYTTSTSNGTRTFLFFDDFNGSSLDATKWYKINGNIPKLSNGTLNISATTDPGKLIAITAPTQDNYILRARFNVTSGTYTDERIGLSVKTDMSNGRGYNYVFHDFINGNQISFLDDLIMWDNRGGAWSKNTWYTEEIYHNGTYVKARINDGSWQQSLAWSGRTGYLALNIGSFASDGAVSEWDWALVYKSVTNAPVWSTWGIEQEVPINITYIFSETNPNSTWQSISIHDSSYGDALTNVSILNATSGRWESILTSAFTGGNSTAEHVNVTKGASGNASSYDAGGGQIKIRYNWTNSLFNNNNLGVDMINVTVLYKNSIFLLNIATNTINVPESNRSDLQLKYNVSGDNFTVQIMNISSGWENVTILNTTDMPYRNITLNSSWLILNGTFSGNVASINRYDVFLRYLGINQSVNGTLYLDYQRVYSS
jgi:hypothetical protein